VNAQLLLWLIALILFVVSAFVNPPRFALLPIGLAFLTAGFLVPVIS
jgi:hypothetical protein